MILDSPWIFPRSYFMQLVHTPCSHCSWYSQIGQRGDQVSSRLAFPCYDHRFKFHLAFVVAASLNIMSLLLQLLLQFKAHPDKLRHLAPATTVLYHGGFVPKNNSLGAAMENLHEGDVYTAVRALLERGCKTSSEWLLIV